MRFTLLCSTFFILLGCQDKHTSAPTTSVGQGGIGGKEMLLEVAFKNKGWQCVGFDSDFVISEPAILVSKNGDQFVVTVDDKHRYSADIYFGKKKIGGSMSKERDGTFKTWTFDGFDGSSHTLSPNQVKLGKEAIEIYMSVIP